MVVQVALGAMVIHVVFPLFSILIVGAQPLTFRKLLEYDFEYVLLQLSVR